MSIDNWQTWNEYSSKQFWDYMNIMTETYCVSESEAEWLKQWRTFEANWVFVSEEEHKSMRLGHYIGWINRERTL